MADVTVYNILAVYSRDRSRVLMCLRAKEPYKGLYNLVGGKRETGETSLAAAYRELFEETGISADDVTLTHIMDFTYKLSNVVVEAFAGRLKRERTLTEEVNRLFWHDADNNFFDMNVYAGEGNIGHVMEQIKLHPGALT